MILYYFLFFILLFGAVKKFKTTFLIYTAFKILLHSGVCLKVDAPVITFEFAANISLLVLFFIRQAQNKKLKDEEKFPLQSGFLLIFFSYTISTLFGVQSFQSSFLGTFQIIINEYIIIYLLWRVLMTKEDVLLLVKSFVIVFFIVCIYGLFEFVTELNPVLEFEMSFFSPIEQEGKFYYKPAELALKRLGFSRIHSFFPISITFGAYCALFVSFYFYYIYTFKEKKNIADFLSIILLIIGVFISNSRSPLLCMFIGMIPILLSRIKSLLNIRVIIFSAIGIVFLFQYIEPYFANLESVFNSDADDEVGGSSIEMRLIQITVAINYFLDSPIIGHGIRAINTLMGGDAEKLLGAESIWIWLLIERGLLGIISYLYLYINILMKMYHKKYKSFYIFFTLAWFALSTMTTTPGLSISFYLTFILIVYRLQLLETDKHRENIS